MKIGILQTGHAPEELAHMGPYADHFARLLEGQGLTFQTWEVVEDVFPDSPRDAEGWLITGSKHGAYEDLPWIKRLMAFIRACFDADRPMVGVCFGHQVIAAALGGRVEKFAGGWSVGPVAYDFGDARRVVQAWHQDQVTEPPKGAETVARSPFCAHAALVYPGKAYTVQPHPEYGDAFIQGLIDTRGPGVVPDAQLKGAQAALGQDLDRAVFAQEFARFFRERRVS